MSTIEDCRFCDLGKRLLKENELAALFLSNPRRVAGHFLVIPKRHIEKPWELTTEEVQAVFELILFTQKRITEKLAVGCDVRQNYRPFLKQSRTKVDHIHYHVIPRDLEDELHEKVEKYETELFKELTEEEHDRMAKIIIRA